MSNVTRSKIAGIEFDLTAERFLLDFDDLLLLLDDMIEHVLVWTVDLALINVANNFFIDLHGLILIITDYKNQKDLF